MNLNLEPNILLILIGSIFVLIGVSGKIFIEKFSVVVSSFGSRLFVSLLGLIMLGIGIVGPNNIQHKEPSTASSSPQNEIQQPVPPSTHSAWFHKIIGTYTGIATSSGIDYPTNTTFVIDSHGNITGTYVVEESDRMMGGS